LSSSNTFAVSATVLLFVAGTTEAAEPALNSSPAPFSITSLTSDGTNLYFRAVVPTGLERVTLEMRASWNEPWEEKKLLTNTAQAADLSFSIGIPRTPTGLFRLKGIANPELLSPEVQYVSIPSLASTNNEAVFHFKGIIDGSDKILINHAGALWEHVNWDWPPGSVTVNDRQWDSREKNYITTAGTNRFLPVRFSLSAVELQVINGRDMVALERTPNGLAVYLDDTFPGADEYEFTIRFLPAASNVKAKSSPKARIKIEAQIDGSDTLRITPKEAVWEHGAFGMPRNVKLYGIPWDAETSTVLSNEGTNMYLSAGVDLSTAKIVNRKGRDLVTMWAEESAVLVKFADNPNASDDYEIEIAFGE
jgi:hypothetical protein